MHFLRNGSDATPPLLFQSDQPGKFFSPFILHYSASRPIPPPRRLLSREIRIYASNAKTPPSGRLSPTYSINSHDRQVFFIAILELSIYFQRWKSNFIYFSFFSFFFFFFFFSSSFRDVEMMARRASERDKKRGNRPVRSSVPVRVSPTICVCLCVNVLIMTSLIKRP